ncbi:MAG: YhdH/YhfP family quinone oxidoreductase [Kangiellaceae bacterium]|nr:YhdH/YhfP family quinone oxidoreductase [Kangiellaceae bacterium]
MKFLACRIYKDEETVSHRLQQMDMDELSEGEVVVRVHYSGVNYKDALAATGKGAILKKFPLNGGIDLSGIVESSSSERFTKGQEVIVNGCGLGEIHDGGLAEYARVPADWVMELPRGLSMKEAMVLGTAGFTAALAIHRMLVNGQEPTKGPIVVTGASGGVGSNAINMLSGLGFETIAVSGRTMFKNYLRELGASKVCSVDELNLSERPLDKGVFGGAIDNVGGQLLNQILAHTNLWGNVASIGLADTHKFSATVFPFILRGISLLGVSSTNCPMSLRKEIWGRLGGDLKPNKLNKILTEEVALKDVSQVFEELLERKRYGRTIVNCL